MTILVRTIALILAIGTMAAPVLLSLVIASLEPSRPIRVSSVAPFAVGGLAAAAGYWVVAAIPHRLACAALELRILVACLMAVPSAVSIYLLAVTDSKVIVGLCTAAITGTVVLFAGCVWPAWVSRSNLVPKRTTYGDRLLKLGGPMRALTGIVCATLFFGLLGPLIGGLPLNLLIFPIVPSYLIGAVPALVTGFLFSLMVLFARTRFRTKAGLLLCGGVLGGLAMSVVVYIAFPTLVKPFQAILHEAVKARHAAGFPPGFRDTLFVILASPLVVLPLIGAGVAGGAACGWLLPRPIRTLLIDHDVI